MSTTTRARLRLSRVIALATVLALVVTGALWWAFSPDGDKRVTAYFDRAVGLYEGSDVKVLGVTVGEVESITPGPNRVAVVASFDPQVPVAASSGAVVIAPSLVSGRYIQFTKLTDGGSRLADGDVIPTGRTETPVEIDEIYRSLNGLAGALGPKGANSRGALSELVKTGAENFAGNGEKFNKAIRKFSNLARTLAGSEQDFFGTVKELQTFTSMLATDDKKVESLNQKLAAVSQTLADDRDELSGALRSLAGALGKIKKFIADNRERIESNVDKLADTTQLLVDNRESLAEALDVIPLAASNVHNTYDADSGTLQVRALLLEYFLNYDPAGGGSSPGSVPMPLPSTTTPGGGE